MITKRKTTTAKKTTKQAAPALDPATMPDDELKTELDSLLDEFKKRAYAAEDAKKERIAALRAELAELTGEPFYEDDDVYHTPEGPKSARAYDLRNGTFRPIVAAETDLQDYDNEWEDRRAWAMLGGLIGNGVFAVPDLDMFEDCDRLQMVDHLEGLISTISLIFSGNNW